MKDSEQREIKKGDKVVYAREWKYSTILTKCTVTDVSSHQVKMGRYNTTISSKVIIINR